MRHFLRIWAVVVVAAKRLLSQPWLAVATALGLVMSVALALSIPLYADAVYYRILREELWGEPDVGQTDLPLTLMFRYIGGWEESLEWERVAPADAYMSDHGVKTLRLPVEHLVRHFRTDNFGLFPGLDIDYSTREDPTVWVNFAYTSDLADHTTLSEGRWPNVAPMAEDAPVEVLLSDTLATELGVQVDDTYTAYFRSNVGGTFRHLEIPVRISGIWHANDGDDLYWFADPAKLQEMLFVREETLQGRLADYLDKEIYTAIWYLVLDGSQVHADDVGFLVGRILSVRQRMGGLLPNTRLDLSPMEALRAYWDAAGQLTILLYAFSIPIVGLILAFIGLVVGLAVGRQRNEIAVLRSRGGTVSQILGISALEGLLLGGVALAAGLPMGRGIAHLIGRARSFLDFSFNSRLRVEATMATVYFGLATVGLALVAQVVPAFGAARHTIVSYKRERARLLRPPWWHRMWLDVLLLIPAIYGGYLLRQQGSIIVPMTNGEAMGDPFQNPLLFLVPSLGVFALTLFVLRILPLVMRLVSWIAARLGLVGPLMAARHLARTPGFYFAPLILLVLTLSLSTFVASLAQTLDQHLHDQRYYQIGADVRLVEQGEAAGGQRMPGSPTAGGGGADDGPLWFFLPVAEHLKVPGVQAAARVGRYRAFHAATSGRQAGTFIGIDRADFTHVTFWRDDFAQESLGTLMNALAMEPCGVLVPRSLLQQHAYTIGDVIPLVVDTYGRRTNISVTIVGAFELFPTWYPTDESQGTLFVGNLDYLFREIGSQYPYDVWLDTAPNVDYKGLVAQVEEQDVWVQYWSAPMVEVVEEQRRPERQGLFGVLSVGFIAAALLTALGFVLYAFFSFSQRFVELGILRAVGLSTRQMVSFLAWELIFLVMVGLGAGTGLGVWMSQFFIPYLQVGPEPSAQIPPYQVEIFWPAVFRLYGLFGVLFFVALGLLTFLLMRMRIFQAIKMGETA